MALPEKAIDIILSGKQLRVTEDAYENGKAKVSAYLGDIDKRVRVFLPAGTKISAVRMGQDTMEIHVQQYRKQPEICYADKEGMRCNWELQPKDMFELFAYPKFFIAYQELKAEKPEVEQAMRDIVRRIVIDERDSKNIGGLAELHKDGTCTIRLFTSTLATESKDDVKRVLAHELGHCIEHYARKTKMLPKARGEWQENRPIGAELRAEKFAHRLTRRSPFLRKRTRTP